ncbi:unnamed protein product [Sphagnum jensenii]|uniref:CS domain-containing protein n=1 Tax=Sphagnum jensenii TaxID=128206 RepID=A0ABP0VHF4_9BRYO
MASTRIKFEHEGTTVYEWDQTLDEINIYIIPPPNVTRKQLDIKLTSNHVSVGLVGVKPFIDEDTGGTIKLDESTWTLVDGELTITLQKMIRADKWTCALRGADTAVDLFTQEKIKKELMLERFQEEVCQRNI